MSVVDAVVCPELRWLEPKRCPIVQAQPEGAKEPDTNPSVPQLEEQPDATGGKVLVDYSLDVNYVA